MIDNLLGGGQYIGDSVTHIRGSDYDQTGFTNVQSFAEILEIAAAHTANGMSGKRTKHGTAASKVSIKSRSLAND